jgi:hypothetical protein
MSTRFTLAFTRVAVAAFAISIFTACSSTGSTPEGAALQQALIGIWGASTDGGKTFSGFEEYKEDGTFLTQGKLPDGTTVRLSGTFKVKGRTSCTEVTETSIPKIMPVHHVSCGEILSIDAAKREIRLLSYGKTFTDYRLEKLPDTAKE